MADTAWIGDTHTKIGRLGSVSQPLHRAAAHDRGVSHAVQRATHRAGVLRAGDRQQGRARRPAHGRRGRDGADDLRELAARRAGRRASVSPDRRVPAIARRIRARARPANRRKRGRRGRRARVQGEAQARVEAATDEDAPRASRLAIVVAPAFAQYPDHPDQGRRALPGRRRHRRVRAPRERAPRQGARPAGGDREPRRRRRQHRHGVRREGAGRRLHDAVQLECRDGQSRDVLEAALRARARAAAGRRAVRVLQPRRRQRGEGAGEDARRVRRAAEKPIPASTTSRPTARASASSCSSWRRAPTSRSSRIAALRMRSPGSCAATPTS